ncbi:organic solvent tolerance protein OstA [Roseiconus nitratireducens]|uniref:Organic solvent tolerance protein OstA n=1 Tax=Roseiconus nitratireducens TaxID=2605748 RepID=A0A5M6CZC7_9BACT|nr:organic solvent tolerance protein OstA [Roseiconus nitratireducens]KAA5540473.1 organic solvent tolerance protein OstA [Roseiconus nitratireducens]
MGKPKVADAEQTSAIRASGDVVYRWQINDAQASMLQGDCVLIFKGREIKAETILIVADGPRGRVRNRLVIEGFQTADGQTDPTPRTVVWTTQRDPIVQAPQFRGEPEQRPFLMEFLPAEFIEAIGSSGNARPSNNGVAAAQFSQPIPDSAGQNPGGATPRVTAPPAGSVELIAPGSPSVARPEGMAGQSGMAGRPAGALPLPSSAGLPQAGELPPPTVFDDGATTGGQQFFFGGGTKSFQLVARGASMPPAFQITSRPETNESILVARGGVTAVIRDVAATMPDGSLMNLGTVTLSADRIVAWLPFLPNVFDGTTDIAAADGELYLEGDIVFRQGDRVIYADSMYYNVTRETGMVLDAEAISTIPEYQGVVRLKAEVLQQIARGNYRAFDAAVTSSRMGVPRYWLQSEKLEFTEKNRNVIDARTGMMTVDREPFATSSNNFVFLGGIPVLYWPRFSTSLERPVFYVTDIKVRNDAAFGTQILLDWDLFQLLGIENPPDGVDWELSTDYLSDRGPALGTHVDYDLPGLFGYPGHVNGFLDVWGIKDHGKDRLGRDRLDLTPETTNRGRALLRHRQQIYRDYELIAELGYLSDRNFLEQYLENEWDQDVDHTTGLRFRHYYYNQLFDLSAKVQVNDFFMQTERLPALDHYLIGGSFLGNKLTWSMHNHASYSRLNVADEPTDPTEAAEYSTLPGEVQSQGVIASTRQELAMNLPVGPINVRPVASVEASHYGEAADGQPLTRLLGQAGVAMNLPMVRVDPTVQSSLLNMRGLAHKIDWTAEYWYADSDASYEELPLYGTLDDNSQEQFRRRFIDDTFGGTLPTRFDPRNYAYRQGIQRNVTSPNDTLVDDLQQVRLGLNQRFQTKRGLPGRERIVDLVQFDVDTILFPNADRDNFGETIGPSTYDFRYHIGDRFSILSDGYIDFFDEGLSSISAGLRTSRPGVGDVYVGLLSLEGPISSTVFRTTIDYRLNEKWIFSGGTTYDFGETGNVGQSAGLTRIGESLLVRFGVNVDPGRDNVSFGFLVEPRFFARNLGSIGGGLIPPPGIEGLE